MGQQKRVENPTEVNKSKSASLPVLPISVTENETPAIKNSQSTPASAAGSQTYSSKNKNKKRKVRKAKVENPLDKVAAPPAYQSNSSIVQIQNQSFSVSVSSRLPDSPREISGEAIQNSQLKKEILEFLKSKAINDKNMQKKIDKYKKDIQEAEAITNEKELLQKLISIQQDIQAEEKRERLQLKEMIKNSKDSSQLTLESLKKVFVEEGLIKIENEIYMYDKKIFDEQTQRLIKFSDDKLNSLLYGNFDTAIITTTSQEKIKKEILGKIANNNLDFVAGWNEFNAWRKDFDGFVENVRVIVQASSVVIENKFKNTKSFLDSVNKYSAKKSFGRAGAREAQIEEIKNIVKLDNAEITTQNLIRLAEMRTKIRQDAKLVEKQTQKQFETQLGNIVNDLLDKTVNLNQKPLFDLLHQLDIYDKESKGITRSGARTSQIEAIKKHVKECIAKEGGVTKELLIELAFIQADITESDSRLEKVLSKFINTNSMMDKQLNDSLQFLNTIRLQAKNAPFFGASEHKKNIQKIKNMVKQYLTNVPQDKMDGKAVQKSGDELAIKHEALQELAQIAKNKLPVKDSLWNEINKYVQQGNVFIQEKNTAILIEILSLKNLSIENTIFEGLSLENTTKEDIQSVLGKACNKELSNLIKEYHFGNLNIPINPSDKLSKLISKIVKLDLLDEGIPNEIVTDMQIDTLYRAKIISPLIKQNFNTVIKEFEEIEVNKSLRIFQLIETYIFDKLIPNNEQNILDYISFINSLTKKLPKIENNNKTFYSHQILQYLEKQDFNFLFEFFTNKEAKYDVAHEFLIGNTAVLEKIQQHAVKELVKEIVNKLEMPLKADQLKEIDGRIVGLESSMLGEDGRFKFSTENTLEVKKAIQEKMIVQLNDLLLSDAKKFQELIEKIESNPNFIFDEFEEMDFESVIFNREDLIELYDIAQIAFDAFLLKNQGNFENRGKDIIKNKMNTSKYEEIKAFIQKGSVIKVSKTTYCNSATIEEAIVEFVQEKTINKVNDDKYFEILTNFPDLKDILAEAYNSPRIVELEKKLEDKSPTSEKLNIIENDIKKSEDYLWKAKRKTLQAAIKNYQFRISYNAAQEEIIKFFKPENIKGIILGGKNTEWAKILESVTQKINALLLLEGPEEKLKEIMFSFIQKLKENIKAGRFEFGYTEGKEFNFEKGFSEIILKFFAEKNIPGSKAFLAYYELMAILRDEKKWDVPNVESLKINMDDLKDLPEEQKNALQQKLLTIFNIILNTIETKLYSSQSIEFVLLLGQHLSVVGKDLTEKSKQIFENICVDINSNATPSIIAFTNALNVLILTEPQYKKYLSQIYQKYVEVLAASNSSAIKYYKTLIEVITKTLPQYYSQKFGELLELLSNEEKWHSEKNKDYKQLVLVLDALTEPQKNLVSEVLNKRYEKLINENQVIFPQLILSLDQKLDKKLALKAINLIDETISNKSVEKINQFENALVFILAARDKEKLEKCGQYVDTLYTQYIDTLTKLNKDENTHSLIQIMRQNLPDEYISAFNSTEYQNYIKLLEFLSDVEKWKDEKEFDDIKTIDTISFSEKQKEELKTLLGNHNEKLLEAPQKIIPFLIKLTNKVGFDILPKANEIIAKTLVINSDVKSDMFINAIKFIVAAENLDKLKECLDNLNKFYEQYVEAIRQDPQDFPKIHYLEKFIEYIEKQFPDKYPLAFRQLLKLLNNEKKENINNAEFDNLELLTVMDDSNAISLELKTLVKNSLERRYSNLLAKNTELSVSLAESKFIVALADKLGIKINFSEKINEIFKKATGKKYFKRFENILTMINALGDEKLFTNCQNGLKILYKEYFEVNKKENVSEKEKEKEKEKESLHKRIALIEKNLPIKYHPQLEVYQLFYLLENNQKWVTHKDKGFEPQIYNTVIEGLSNNNTQIKSALEKLCQKILTDNEWIEVSDSAAKFLVALSNKLKLNLINIVQESIAKKTLQPGIVKTSCFKSALTLIIELNAGEAETVTQSLDGICKQYSLALRKNTPVANKLQSWVQIVTEKLPKKYSYDFIHLLKILNNDMECEKAKKIGLPAVNVQNFSVSHKKLIEEALLHRYSQTVTAPDKHFSLAEINFVKQLSKELNLDLFKETSTLINEVLSHNPETGYLQDTNNKISQFEKILSFVIEDEIQDNIKNSLKELALQYSEMFFQKASERNEKKFNYVKALLEILKKKLPKLYNENWNYIDVLNFLHNDSMFESLTWSNPRFALPSALEKQYISVVHNWPENKKALLREKLQVRLNLLLGEQSPGSISESLGKFLWDLSNIVKLELYGKNVISDITTQLDRIVDSKDFADFDKFKNKLNNAVTLILLTKDEVSLKACNKLFSALQNMINTEQKAEVPNSEVLSKINILLEILIKKLPDFDQMANYENILDLLSDDKNWVTENIWLRKLEKLRYNTKEEFLSSLKNLNNIQKADSEKALNLRYAFLLRRADQEKTFILASTQNFMKLLSQNLGLNFEAIETFNVINNSLENHEGCKVLNEKALNFLGKNLENFTADQQLIKAKAIEVIIDVTERLIRENSSSKEKLNEIDKVNFENAVSVINILKDKTAIEECAVCADKLNTFLVVLTAKQVPEKLNEISEYLKILQNENIINESQQNKDNHRLFSKLYFLLIDDQQWKGNTLLLEEFNSLKTPSEMEKFIIHLSALDGFKKEVLVNVFQARFVKFSQIFQQGREGKPPEAVNGKTPYPIMSAQLISTEAWRFMGALNKGLGANLDENNIVYRAMNAIRYLTKSTEEKRFIKDAQKSQTWFQNALAVVVANGNPDQIKECQLRLTELCSHGNEQGLVSKADYVHGLREIMQKEGLEVLPLKNISDISAYLSGLELSADAITEILEMQNIKNPQEKQKLRKQLYLWRYYALENSDFTPKISEEIKTLYEPVIKILKTNKETVEVIQSASIDNSKVENFEAKLNKQYLKIKVQKELACFTQSTESPEKLLNSPALKKKFENALYWLKDNSIDPHHKILVGEMLLKYIFFPVQNENEEIDLFNIMSAIPGHSHIAEVITAVFPTQEMITNFYFEGLFASERLQENIENLVEKTLQKAHFDFVNQVFNLASLEELSSYKEKFSPTLGPYGEKLKKILFQNILEKIKANAENLKITSTDEQAFNSLKEQVKWLKMDKGAEISEILRELLARLNQKIDNDSFVESKIKLKNALEDFILDDAALSKAYLANIYTNNLGSSVTEVLGTTNQEKIEAHFNFIVKLMLKSESNEVNQSLLDHSSTGEYGLQLKRTLQLPTLEKINNCFRWLKDEPENRAKFNELERYVNLLDICKDNNPEISETFSKFISYLYKEIQQAWFDSSKETKLKDNILALISKSTSLSGIILPSVEVSGSESDKNNEQITNSGAVHAYIHRIKI